jgi:hypothetical protein
MRKISFIMLLLIISLTLSGCSLFSKPTETEEPTASPVVTETPGESSAPTPAESQPPETAEPEPSASPAPDGYIKVKIDDQEREVEAASFTGTLRSSPLLKFSVYIDSSQYEESQTETAFRYTYTGDSSGSTFLEISFHPDTTSSELSPTVMSSYFEFTVIEFASYTKIGSDKLLASTINANNDNRAMEAYLIDVSGGVVQVAVSTKTEYSASALPYLHAMLDTLTLE